MEALNEQPKTTLIGPYSDHDRLKIPKLERRIIAIFWSTFNQKQCRIQSSIPKVEAQF